MTPESHKIIGKEILTYTEIEHKVKLNEKKLLWGSIAPDFLPKYKFIRHYKDESINYISREILKISIILSRIEDKEDINPILINKLSKKIGVVSHYLTDYTTHPHARRITCLSSSGAREHLKYETDLYHFLKSYSFEKPLVINNDVGVFECNLLQLRRYIVEDINQIVDEYLKKDIKFINDVEYAFTLNLHILDLIFETEKVLSVSPQLQTV